MIHCYYNYSSEYTPFPNIPKYLSNTSQKHNSWTYLLTRVREVFHSSISLCRILSLRLRDFSYGVRPRLSKSAFRSNLLILVQEKQFDFCLYNMLHCGSLVCYSFSPYGSRDDWGKYLLHNIHIQFHTILAKSWIKNEHVWNFILFDMLLYCFRGSHVDMLNLMIHVTLPQ